MTSVRLVFDLFDKNQGWQMSGPLRLSGTHTIGTYTLWLKLKHGYSFVPLQTLIFFLPIVRRRIVLFKYMALRVVGHILDHDHTPWMFIQMNRSLRLILSCQMKRK